MKKLIAVALAVLLVLILGGCSEKYPNWSIESDVGNGVYVVVPDASIKSVSWYCTVDVSTNEILTVNMIYPDSFGEPAETICTARGKRINCEITSAEQEGDDIIFYQLPAGIASFDYDGEVIITQKFDQKEIKLKLKPTEMSKIFLQE